jgi:hypothetical protein
MDKSEEPKIIADVAARVSARLPDLTEDAVHDEVLRLFQEYESSRVRSFVPILVEREAVATLRGRHSKHVA